MLVQCPNCKTTYKVSDEVLKGASPAFRCSRCRHTFELEAEPPEDMTADSDIKDSEPEAPDQELSFSFAPQEIESPAKDTIPEPDDSTKTTDEPTPPAIDFGAQWSLKNSETQDERAFTLAESDPPSQQDKVLGEPKDFPGEAGYFQNENSDSEADGPDKVLPISSYMDQQASIMPYMTLFAILLMVFSLIAVIGYAHPKASEDLMKGIPLFGASVLKNNHLKDGVIIQSVHGGFQTIQGNRDVFVITGVAVNQNPTVVREIQLTGKVYNDTGKELEQQTVWLGNTLSAKIIRDMTTEDIPHLQSLKPLKSFEMPPGESIPFAIVFLKSSKTAKNFTCEISLAEGAV